MVTELLVFAIVIMWMIAGFWVIEISEMETKKELKEWMTKRNRSGGGCGDD